MSKAVPFLLAMLLVLCVVQPTVARELESTGRRQPAGPLTGLLGFRVDPTGSVVQILPSVSRDLVDARFDFVSAVCTNCGGGCPPMSRTIQVVLQANAAVAAGYGVSNLTSSNWTATDISQSTSGALAPGEQLTVTLTGNVLSCSSWFNVWFSLCDPTPSSWTDPCPACPAAPMAATVIHGFAGGTTDGQYPYGPPVIVGDTLYGAAYEGGTLNRGVVFSFGTTTGTFTILRSFVGGLTDGKNPTSSPAYQGSKLYGVTGTGGFSSKGVLYSLNSNGSAYSVLRHFTGAVGDGGAPCGVPVVAGGQVFGMATQGGSANLGVVYAIGTDGNGFSVLHSFAGGTTDGKWPSDSLTLDGSTLYGMTYQGGASNSGVVFRIGADGNGYQVVHSFGSAGIWPNGSLFLEDGILYGTTMYGGTANRGTVFSMRTDGSDVRTLHSFTGGANDGEFPEMGRLASCGSTLYGTTREGGASDLGVVFAVGKDGTWYQNLHGFSGGGGGGSVPRTSLTRDGGVFYGMTYSGGATNVGVIFKVLAD